MYGDPKADAFGLFVLVLLFALGVAVGWLTRRKPRR